MGFRLEGLGPRLRVLSFGWWVERVRCRGLGLRFRVRCVLFWGQIATMQSPGALSRLVWRDLWSARERCWPLACLSWVPARSVEQTLYAGITQVHCGLTARFHPRF